MSLEEIYNGVEEATTRVFFCFLVVLLIARVIKELLGGCKAFCAGVFSVDGLCLVSCLVKEREKGGMTLGYHLSLGVEHKVITLCVFWGLLFIPLFHGRREIEHIYIDRIFE